MRKSSASYAGNPNKFGFPQHKQEHPAGCGPACLRMLAEWITGQPQSEYHWRAVSGWTPKGALRPPKMIRAVVTLLGQPEPPPRNPAATANNWRNNPSLPADAKEDDVVYLLHTDSYGYDGENLYHWIILLDLFSSNDRKHQLALYADPLCNELQLWPWASLLESKVTHALRIERSAPQSP